MVVVRKLLTADAGGLQRGHTNGVDGFGPDRCYQGNGTHDAPWGYVGTGAHDVPMIRL